MGKKHLLTVVIMVFVTNSIAQNYYELTSDATILYNAKKYNESAIKWDNAFNKQEGFANDYYNAFWNGSDDNASGVVAILEIAKAFLATGIKPKRTIVFAAWDAEEKGMYGSNYFLRHPTQRIVIANVNFDMISRNPSGASTKHYCKVIYSKSFETFKANTQKFIKENKLALDIEFDSETIPIRGTDSDSFAERKIPVISFETGKHKDYHKPSDHSNRADIKKMTDIIKLGFLHVWKLAQTEKLI